MGRDLTDGIPPERVDPKSPFARTESELPEDVACKCGQHYGLTRREYFERLQEATSYRDFIQRLYQCCQDHVAVSARRHTPEQHEEWLKKMKRLTGHLDNPDDVIEVNHDRIFLGLPPFDVPERQTES